MKTPKSNLKILALGALAITLAMFASVMFAPTHTASADPGTPPPPAKAGERANEILEKFYQRELKALAAQKATLAKANDLLTKAQDYINEQKANGKDVSKLEAILARMKQQVAHAQSAHDLAASTLNTHAGFDNNGLVTDAKQARETINQARKDINDAHRTLVNITAEFRRILNEHRDNGKKP